MVDTALGRLSILICFDVEQGDLIQEAVDRRCWLVLNPSLVGPGDTLELVFALTLTPTLTNLLGWLVAAGVCSRGGSGG